ncbi:hypothetical protein SAMN05216334_1177 [Nitrosomonas ureae]|uniref:Uncharacterized protein n=1 Tax=Nitrosomonas ureae TaxID=44577 RepID=A0A1H5W8I7_9PROT|nr:hypothetical protein SAMN05216334_1177 [Nitrosomonas ureae]
MNANKLHSVFGYQDSDENAPDYTNQTTESGFALPPSSVTECSGV